jgi:hypothetical protein
MDQRLVKPIFWPVLLLSCAVLSLTAFFLIGGMISSRFEDYLIAFLTGFILFVAARIVVKNAQEPPRAAIGLMFAVIGIAVLAVFVMYNALVYSDHVDFAAFEGHRMHAVLADMPRGVWHVGEYREWATSLSRAGFDLTGRFYIALHRALFLSYGIIVGILFIALQIVTCVLLFVGTKPPKKIFNKTH